MRLWTFYSTGNTEFTGINVTECQNELSSSQSQIRHELIKRVPPKLGESLANTHKKIIKSWSPQQQEEKQRIL